MSSYFFCRGFTGWWGRTGGAVLSKGATCSVRSGSKFRGRLDGRGKSFSCRSQWLCVCGWGLFYSMI